MSVKASPTLSGLYRVCRPGSRLHMLKPLKMWCFCRAQPFRTCILCWLGQRPPDFAGRGAGASVDLLIEDLAGEPADRPCDVVRVADVWIERTRPAQAAAIRVAADMGEQGLDLRTCTVAVLAAIAYRGSGMNRDRLQAVGTLVFRGSLPSAKTIGENWRTSGGWGGSLSITRNIASSMAATS